jgi:hypothetical protein
MGEPLVGPLRVCVTEPDCTQAFQVDPGVHELAAEPHAVFRLGDIRGSDRSGDWLGLKIHVDRRIEGLVPFVLVHAPERRLALTLRERRGTVFDLHLGHDPPLPPDTEFWIYLMTVGGR